ncbi:MAG: phytanoyl-CoA dioxygenase family protein [Sneathiellales bacterium]|nr:phytanoyl-CoA dioxygenase family protein [Sneathiellales bacterium]
MKPLSETRIAKYTEELNDKGYTVLEGIIPKDLLLEIKDALQEVEKTHDIGYRKTAFEGLKTVRIYNLLAYHKVFEKLPVFPGTLPIAERALDKELLLSSLSAICLGPDQESQPLHGDSQMIPIPRPHIPLAVNSMWALTDFTEENGATRIVPGSHKFDHNPLYNKTYETECAEMPAGSILMWNSALWHGGGENRTSERRDGIACYYCAGWVRAQENQQLGVPFERLKSFPRRLQEMCGFSVYQGVYGHIDNKDPIQLLGQEQTRGMVWEASDEVQTHDS